MTHIMHNAIIASVQTPSTSAKPILKMTPPMTHNTIAQYNFVSNNDEEILLATVLVKVQNSEEEFITLRVFFYQGS